jgi:hypothetical protein
VNPARPQRMLRRPGSACRGGVGCSVPSHRWPGPFSEQERRYARSLYETEMRLREEGVSGFVYDEERDLFRFTDGRFAFSRTYANRKVLEERGYQP